MAMENEVIENHQRYLERVALYRTFGYDIEEERSFIIEKACPFSDNILEAGTGKGYFTLALARLGFHFTSFDISAGEQRYARLNLAYFGLAGHVCIDVADIECLPYPDASFDTVFAVNFLHHLYSVRTACDALVRLLSPSGKIILSDFNMQGFAVVDKIHALEGRQHKASTGAMAEMNNLLKECGFIVDEHQGVYQDILVACRR